MIATAGAGLASESGDITATFGLRSTPLVAAMAAFGAAYLLVVVYSCRSIDSPLSWVGLAAAFLLFAGVGVVVLGVRGDPLLLRHTVFTAAGTVLATTVGLVSLPDPSDHVMQTGPPIGASVIVLAFLAVRGRPLAAWLASGCITVVAVLWAAQVGMGAGWGLAITVPGYAVMIMGSLFSVMLRPMTRQIYALRAASAERAAAEAAASAAAEFRGRQLVEFEERAHPTLVSIVERHDFAEDEVRAARLLEAQLRDGIRAPGLDGPQIRAAAWQARSRGVVVLLLDDWGPDVSRDPEVDTRLTDTVVAALHGTLDGQVTARILPAGREPLATVTIDSTDRGERIEVHADGSLRSFRSLRCEER